MSPLESRKQLLLAESELNRAALVADLTTLTTGARALGDRAASCIQIASSLAVLVPALVTVVRAKPTERRSKTSWLKTILNGVGLISALVSLLPQKSRDETDS